MAVIRADPVADLLADSPSSRMEVKG